MACFKGLFSSVLETLSPCFLACLGALTLTHARTIPRIDKASRGVFYIAMNNEHTHFWFEDLKKHGVSNTKKRKCKFSRTNAHEVNILF